MKTFFLDTETTGLDGKRDRIVEIAVVDEHGCVVVDTLVDPGRPIPFEASRIHGIRDHMVRGCPNFEQVWSELEPAIRGHRVVIYNASFDCRFLPDGLAAAGEVKCAMRAYGERVASRSGRRSKKLIDAAAHVGHFWGGDAHRALADALACRSVWIWLETGTAPPPLYLPKVVPLSLAPNTRQSAPAKRDFAPSSNVARTALPKKTPSPDGIPSSPSGEKQDPSTGIPWGWIAAAAMAVILLSRL